jgi:hypothetical protein
MHVLLALGVWLRLGLRGVDVLVGWNLVRLLEGLGCLMM